jgi:acyl carrier protein
MSGLDERLYRCFDVIFEGLSSDQIRAASIETLPSWDSLASVTLVAVIEQEFNVQIDPLDLPELTSFSAVKIYISTRINLSAS